MRTLRTLVLWLVPVALAASCATGPRAKKPAITGTMPRRCAWQLGITRASLSVTASRPAESTVDELGKLEAVYHELQASAAPADLAVCRREVEPLVANLALGWGRAPHHHQFALWAERALELHAALFPDAANHGEIEYALAEVIAGLLNCGCAGDRDDPERWRAAERAYRAARESSQRVDVRWADVRIPLVEAAQKGEALARALAEKNAPPSR